MSETDSSTKELIRDAGGILLRVQGGRLEVLVIHRTQHGDWTLPKGHLEGDETYTQAALREVKEETGILARLGPHVGWNVYEVDGRPKIVKYWRMEVVEPGTFTPGEEVDQCVWLDPSEAYSRLSHEGERRMVETAIQHETASATGFWRWLIRWLKDWFNYTFLGGRGSDRVRCEYEITRIEFAALAGNPPTTDLPWIIRASELLEAAGRSVGDDWDCAWRNLNAARRLMVLAYSDEEVLHRAIALREEAVDKTAGWRGRTIKRLLSSLESEPPATPTRAQLMEALQHRDEISENMYYKMGLISDQLGLIFWVATLPPLGILLVLLACDQAGLQSLDAVACAKAGKGPCVSWTSGTALAVIVVGILGAAFSAIYSIIESKNDPIPAVNNKYITLSRVCGGGAIGGLAGYALYGSGLVNVTIGHDGLSAWLALAFLFGVAGERPMSRIISSTFGEKKAEEGTKPRKN